MKLFTFKIILMLVVLLGAPMIIPGPDGKPIMSIDDWIPRDLIRSLKSGTETLTDAGAELLDEEAGPAQIYAWRDASGAIHYSDTPVNGAELVEVSDNTLQIPADRFVQHGLAPPLPPEPSSSPLAILLEEKPATSAGKSSSASKSSTSLKDLEELVNGDYSKAGELLKNLPELLEQAKQARQQEPEER